MLATGGFDSTVRLWDVASHQQLGPSLTDFTNQPAESAAVRSAHFVTPGSARRAYVAARIKHG